MTLEEFITDEKIRLAAFERYWMENHKKSPENFPLELDEDDEDMWDEQYHAFKAFQLEHVKKI